MKKQSVWKYPLSYSGPRDNKQAISQLSKMCFGLSALAHGDLTVVAKKIETIGVLLQIKISMAGRKAFIFANITDIYEDLTSLRSVLCDADNEGEIEYYLNSLEKDVSLLGNFLEYEIDDSPMNANMNRSVRRFIAKKAAVETIARATKNSLIEAEKKLDRLRRLKTSNDYEKGRKVQKIANLSAFIKARQNAVDTLDSIVDRLSELEDTARLSPGLARRLNQLVHIKPLADFYDKPLRSQRERESLYMHLYYLVQNQIGCKENTDKLNAFLNQTALGEAVKSINKPQATPTVAETISEKQPKEKLNKQKNFNIGGKQ